MRGRVAGGEDPAGERRAGRAPAPPTVEELVQDWLRDGPAAAPNKRASSWRHDASRLTRHIIPLLGARALDQLTPADIERAQQAIVEGATAADVRTGARGRAIVRGGRSAARAAITTLSACLAWGAAHGRLANNPAAGVRKIAGVKRERFLSEAETARLMTALDDLQASGRLASVFADAFRLLLLTGARKTEIAALTWDEVDLERGVIQLRQTRAKNGDKVIMLSRAALAIVAGRPRTARFVLPSAAAADTPIVGLQKAWARVRAAAKLPGLRIHDLRHSFASLAAADGASLPMIAKALGHAHTATTSRYAHLADDAARRVADGVGRRVDSARARGVTLRAPSTAAPPSTLEPQSVPLSREN